jgi:hypothetical protein
MVKKSQTHTSSMRRFVFTQAGKNEILQMVSNPMILMDKNKISYPNIVWIALLLLAGLMSGLLIFIKISPRVSLQDITGIFKPKTALEAPASSSSLQVVPYEDQVIDDQISGDIKLVGDLDGDGYPDLVVGGMVNEKMNWYRYPSWEKSVIAVPGVEFTTDGALGDVDGDGDLDIVVPDGDGQNNLLWFQNPLPAEDPGGNRPWSRQVIGTIGSWGKDIELADFDTDGRLDVATRSHNEVMIFFQTSLGQWQRVSLSSPALGSEGMASGDIDNDGAVDLVLQGNWLRNPKGIDARQAGNWLAYNVGDVPGNFKALVADINQDGNSDILFSSSEDTADVNWWTPQNGDPTGPWNKFTILPNMEKVHTLQAADIDLDGDTDVVLAQMHTSTAKEILVLYNQDGKGTNWAKQVIATGGTHNGVVADIGNDGDYDIFGANWTGNPPVRLFINHLDEQPGLAQWTYIQVTDQHNQTFGLTFGDVDQDKDLDIISGSFWYQNPGGNMISPWQQFSLPPGMHAILSLDVDGDSHLDLIAQNDEGEIGLYWLETIDLQNNTWESTRFGSVEKASHGLGAQGYRLAQVVEGSQSEILISSGNGIYYFQIPAQPETGNWPRVHISSQPSDEGFAVGDIDGDGHVDIAGTTGDSKQVAWYRNPGDLSGSWQAFSVGAIPEVVFPDRTELADLNGDGHLDIIVTEENGQDNGAHTFWWKAPADPAQESWEKHPITIQATTNSLDTADIDKDGDYDLILGEHRGSKKLAIWENDGQGNLTEKIIATGYESHLGGRTVDLDGDGDLDIVSIAWDASNLIHLFLNDRLTNGSTIPAEASPTDIPTTTKPQIVTGHQLTKPLVLFTFQEGAGNVIHDSSGYGDPLDMTIADTEVVIWLASGGIRVTRPTLILSDLPARKIMSAIQQSGEISLEVWVTPANTSQNGPARIVSLSYDPFLRNFTLGQEATAYEVRLRTTGTSENGIPATLTSTGVVKPELTHIVYTHSQNGGASLYLDGILVASGEIPGDYANWNSSYALMLANELSNDRPWLGDYHRLAIYDQALGPEEIQQHYLVGPSGLPEVAPEEPATTATPTTTSQPPATPTQAEARPSPTSELSPTQTTETASSGLTNSARTTILVTGSLLGVLVLIFIAAWALRKRPARP